MIEDLENGVAFNVVAHDVARDAHLWRLSRITQKHSIRLDPVWAMAYITRKKVCASWRFESWLEICAGSIYYVHFVWQVWHGQLSPRFKFNKLKSFSGVEIDQDHVDKRILRGKGLQYKGQEA